MSGDRLELSRHFIPLRVVQDQNLKFVRHYYWDRSGKRPIRNQMNMDTLGQAIDKDKHFWFNIVSIELYFKLIYMNIHRLEERKK